MKQVRLIHWNAAEAEERAGWLQAAGFEVDARPLSPASLRALKATPPEAIVIDLGRLPSQGRDLGLTLRKQKATRHVPLVFVDGDPEKLPRIRELLPDAVYATWDQIGAALEQAMTSPPADPVVPKSVFEAYARTPLPQKLGIGANSTVALVGAPEGFEATLGELPEGVMLRRGAGGKPDILLWFCTSRQELECDVGVMTQYAAGGGLWIVWPKKASGVQSDLVQPVVRQIGLASGLVDFKVCSLDATWTGLRFSQRQSQSD